jgi:cob(I)alamin adenosyltransferase
MTEKSKVYTKGGDQGETGLVGGTRVSKSDQRIDLYGEVDELNSWVGVVVSHLDNKLFINEIESLKTIQNLLFDLGSNLACESEKREAFNLPAIKEKSISNIELAIDRLDSECPKLTNFILPGGGAAASFLHLSRTVCRKVERKLIQYQKTTGEELPENRVKFINRLSDFFFVLSRYVNLKMGESEVLWKP